MKPTQQTMSVSEKTIARRWHMVDVKGKILGRVAPQIVALLTGKRKNDYVSYLDMGDYVVVVNAKGVRVTGNKPKTKTYTYYSGYPGGLRKTVFNDLLVKNSQEIIRHAVSGMLPKNKLRDRRLARLFIYPGAEHPHKQNLK